MKHKIIINKNCYSWNQGGKLKFIDTLYPISIDKEDFPVVIEPKFINYVIDIGLKTYGKTTVREIFISLKDGELTLWNKCASSFLTQYKGVLLTLNQRSVTLGKPHEQ